MDLRIFDVEHGQCALLSLECGRRVMIDVGHNSSTGWKPGKYLAEECRTSELYMLVITNSDHDHVSGLNNLLDNIDVKVLLRSKGVTPEQLQEIKRQSGGASFSIRRLIRAMETTYTAPADPLVSPGFSYQTFRHDFGTFTDTNNLSLVFFMKCHGIGVMFPGDLEHAGWMKMLERESFRDALKNTSILVASHHGRDNGCCDAVFEFEHLTRVKEMLCRPYYVVCSDMSHAHETQKTTDYYRRKAQGGPFRGQTRHVLTTRNDGTFGFRFGPEGWFTTD